VAHEEAVRRYYRLVDAGELEEMFGLFTDDVVYRRPGYDAIEGIDEFRAFYGSQRVIADGRHSVRSLVADGDRVAVEGDFHGVLRDGRRVALRFADFFSFRGGRIAVRDTYFDAPLV
jgi:steroid Delta-isomerase